MFIIQKVLNLVQQTQRILRLQLFYSQLFHATRPGAIKSKPTFFICVSGGLVEMHPFQQKTAVQAESAPPGCIVNRRDFSNFANPGRVQQNGAGLMAELFCLD
jgi:hypothetical protein